MEAKLKSAGNILFAEYSEEFGPVMLICAIVSGLNGVFYANLHENHEFQRRGNIIGETNVIDAGGWDLKLIPETLRHKFDLIVHFGETQTRSVLRGKWLAPEGAVYSLFNSQFE